MAEKALLKEALKQILLALTQKKPQPSQTEPRATWKDNNIIGLLLPLPKDPF